MNNGQLPTTKKREEWIDILRALAMLFVIFGHIENAFTDSKIFFVLTSPVKIPLFFAITGYVFNPEGGKIGRFFKKLFFGIILPLLLFTVLLLPVKLLAAHFGFIDKSAAQVVKAFLLGDEFWYLTCCIIAEILFFFVRKWVKNIPLASFVELALAVLGMFLIRKGILDTASINIALLAQAFLLLGWLFRLYKDHLLKTPYPAIGSGLFYAAGIVVSFLVFPGKYVDIHRGIYYCIPLNLLMIASGIFMLFAVAAAIKIRCKWLAFIGRNTLFFYVTHEYVIEGITVVLKLLKVSLPSGFIVVIIYLVITCALCAIGTLFVNRFVPFLVGKKKRKAQ